MKKPKKTIKIGGTTVEVRATPRAPAPPAAETALARPRSAAVTTGSKKTAPKKSATKKTAKRRANGAAPRCAPEKLVREVVNVLGKTAVGLASALASHGRGSSGFAAPKSPKSPKSSAPKRRKAKRAAPSPEPKKSAAKSPKKKTKKSAKRKAK